MKKLVSLLLVLVLVLAFTACSTDTKTETPSTDDTANVEETDTTDATTDTEDQTTTEDASADKTAEDIAWPERTVSLVVGYSAGGSVDLNARAYAQYLTEVLGVEVVVNNVAGSSGAVAAQQCKDASNDGYTIFYHQPPLFISYMQGMTDFSIDAFELSAITAFLPGDIIAVNKDLGINTLEELYNYTQEHPGEINVAAAAGTMNYIQALQMVSLGFKINVVDGGNAAERVANLLGGHVDVILNAYSTVKDYMESGDFIALATASSVRAEAYSDVPTAMEEGYDIYFDKLHFACFPEGTDPAIVEKFSQACKTVTEMEEYQDFIWENFGQEAYYEDADEAMVTLDGIWDMLQDYKEELAG